MKRTLITGALVVALGALLSPLGCGSDELEQTQDPNFPEDAGFAADAGVEDPGGDTVVVNTFPERPDAGPEPDAGQPGDVSP